MFDEGAIDCETPMKEINLVQLETCCFTPTSATVSAQEYQQPESWVDRVSELVDLVSGDEARRTVR